MSARAMWKGDIRLGEVAIPVKLHAAVEDRGIHFRLLHKKDKMPVRQAMVNAEDNKVVEYADTRRAYITDDGDMVVLDNEDLASIEPESSREIEVLQLLPPGAIRYQWYQRPYYLEPAKAGDESYAALVQALERLQVEGLARWVMRKKEYVGALRLEAGYLMLVTVHFAGEVVAVDELQPPAGKALRRKDLDMAKKLMGMLMSDFDPAAYEDEYRERVVELIDKKARGGRVSKKRPPGRKPSTDISSALEASLKAERKRA